MKYVPTEPRVKVVVIASLLIFKLIFFHRLNHSKQ